MDVRAENLRILESLRLAIFLSKTTQRAIERHAGFSGGYLSQLLGGTVDLKLWQLLAMVVAFVAVAQSRRDPPTGPRLTITFPETVKIRPSMPTRPVAWT